VEIFPIEE